MTPAGLIALTLAGLILFAVLVALVLTRFVPGPVDGCRPTVSHAWTSRRGKPVSVMDDLPDSNYTTQAEEFAAQVAKEWSER